MNKEELINKIITYNYDHFGNEFGDALVDLKQENKELKRNCNIGNENLSFYRNENKELRQEKYKLILDSNGLINANEILQQQNKELQNKIDKAIKYINDRMIVEQSFCLDMKQCYELTAILKDSNVNE